MKRKGRTEDLELVVYCRASKRFEWHLYHKTDGQLFSKGLSASVADARADAFQAKQHKTK